MLANVVMLYLIDFVTKHLTFKFHLLKFYVDDTLLLTRENKIDIALENFNSFNRNLKFTYEVDNNEKLKPFFDIVSTNENTTWYQKSIEPWKSSELFVTT